MSAADDIEVVWREDATNTVLGRLTARNGSGVATGIVGEGKFVKQEDFGTITAKVLEKDVNGLWVAVATPPTVNAASAILDTPDVSNEIWTQDTIGYNFIFDLAAIYFPNGGKIIRAEFLYTFLGGAVGWGIYVGPVRRVETS